MNQPPPPAEDDVKEFVFLSVIVVVLSAYVLLALLVDAFFQLPVEVSRLLNYADEAICFFFLGEFVFRFYHAPNKLRFMRWGWIDLVSSIPNLALFRFGRVLRLIRLLRVLRAFRSMKHLMAYLFRNKAQGAFTSVALFSALMIIFSSVAILQVENAPTSNIKTASDALWWAYATITTVGYGDRYPVTTEGRLIAALLMTTGVGVFGTFTGFVSAWFLADREAHAAQPPNQPPQQQAAPAPPADR